jgi:hypothetical protein
MAIEKIWTYEGPSEKKKKMDTWRSKWKKEKKVGHMKVQEKKKI